MSALEGYGGTGQPAYPPLQLHRVQPEQIARCPFDMTCSYPSGQCMEACAQPSNHAPLLVDMPTERINRRELARNTFNVYRAAGHGLRASLRHFFRVLRGNC